MGAVLLFLALLVGLIVIPFGLPGLWVMAGALLVYNLAGTPPSPPHAAGIWVIVIVTGLAAIGEVLEFVLAGRFARKYGGSRRAGWGAIIGSIVGAIVGVPVPLVGSVIGAFVGAFAGAWVAEMSRRTTLHTATRVATGALLGRIAAVAAKVGIGCVVVVWVGLALWSGR